TLAFAFGIGVAAAFRVAVQRRAQRVPQESDVSVERGARTTQFFAQALHVDRPPVRFEDAMQLEDAFVLVHAWGLPTPADSSMPRRAIGGKRRGGYHHRHATRPARIESAYR